MSISFSQSLTEHLILIGQKFNSCHAPNSGQFCSTGSEGGTWMGGSPYESDKFEKNASNLGLTIQYDKSIDRDYIVLNKPITLYHGTSAGNIESIKKEGIKIIPRNGQVDGVYLGGKETANFWRGGKTVKVNIPSGEKLYADIQPNAVFIRHDIPVSWIND